MNMRMNSDFLDPGVQQADEADLCDALSAIASDVEKCFRTGARSETAPTTCRCEPPPVWI
jgi:hypothetical protein